MLQLINLILKEVVIITMKFIQPTRKEEIVNKTGEKVLFFIMVIQSTIIGSIYMYSKIEKWNLENSMTVFLYPLFSIALIVFIIISCLASFGYFINKLLSTHKIYFCIPLLITIILFSMSNELFNEMKLREYNFKKYQNERTEIVELILQGEMLPDENGIISLPEKLKNEEMARDGYVYIVNYESKIGIYFCTFTGLMESSAGYVYLTENIFNIDSGINITLQSEYSENWYFCGTF